MTTVHTDLSRVAELLRAECADIQAAMLAIGTDARERGMFPDAEKIRRMNDRAVELHQAAETVDAISLSRAVGPTLIRDDEGEVMVTVPDALTEDAVVVVRYALEGAFRRGVTMGKARRSDELRNLIGAAPLPEAR